MNKPKAIYIATYGAAFARLSLDHQQEGLTLTEDDLERWSDEAHAIAMNAMDMHEERHG